MGCRRRRGLGLQSHALVDPLVRNQVDDLVALLHIVARRRTSTSARHPRAAGSTPALLQGVQGTAGSSAAPHSLPFFSPVPPGRRSHTAWLQSCHREQMAHLADIAGAFLAEPLGNVLLAHRAQLIAHGGPRRSPAAWGQPKSCVPQFELSQIAQGWTCLLISFLKSKICSGALCQATPGHQPEASGGEAGYGRPGLAVPAAAVPNARRACDRRCLHPPPLSHAPASFSAPPPARRCALGGVPLGAARPERDSLLTAPGLRECAGVTCAGQYDGWRGGKPPYFSPSTPLDSSAPGGRPFFYTPGENYTFPPPGYSIEIWDDDESGTLNGYIPLKKESQCPTGTPGSTGWDCTNGNVQCDNRKGCWDSFGIEYFANQKYVEDPVHVEVGAYIGSHEWDPGTSRWWFPYKNSKEGTWSGAYYDQDPLEDIKQKYRCSEYNPTLPGLDWHKPTGGNSYPGGPDQKLHFPNSHEQAKECWDQYKVGSRPSHPASST